MPLLAKRTTDRSVVPRLYKLLAPTGTVCSVHYTALPFHIHTRKHGCCANSLRRRMLRTPARRRLLPRGALLRKPARRRGALGLGCGAAPRWAQHQLLAGCICLRFHAVFMIIITSYTTRIAPHWSRLCYSMTHCAAAVPSAQNGSAALGSASCNALCVCAPCHLAAALLPLQEVAEDASAASGKATSKVGNAMGQLDDEESTTHVTGLYTGV